MKLHHRAQTILALAATIVTTISGADVAKSYRDGVAALDAGRLQDAERGFERALAAARAPGDRGLILDRLGDARAAAGEWRGAREAYQRSLSAWEGAPEPRPLDSVLPLADLANIERRLGQYSRSAALHDQAYLAAVALVGETHPEIAGMLNQRAQLAQEMGDLPAAAELYARAVSVWGRLGRAEQAVAAYPLHNLGLLEVRLGNIRTGRAKLERAQAIWTSTLPASHPVFAGSFAALGEAAAAEGDTEEARWGFEAAIAHAESALGAQHVKVGLLMARYAEALRSLGHKKESRGLRQRAEVILSSHDGWRQAAGTIDIAALERGLR